MAAMVEQGGFDFYARLTARSIDQRVRNELKFLRDEEAVHKAWFLEQLRARGGAPRGSLPPALQEDLEQEFLVPMEKAFSSGGLGDNDKVLRLGSELEQRSIELYQALRDVVPQGQQAELGRIIAEEEAHRRKLEIIRAF